MTLNTAWLAVPDVLLGLFRTCKKKQKTSSEQQFSENDLLMLPVRRPGCSDWTATVSQITAHYNQHMQKNIWKHVEHSECSSWQLRTGGNIHPGSPESSKSLTKSSGAEECPCLPWRSDGRVWREANNMKAWLHPASHQRSRLQSVWWCRGQFPGTL